MSIISKLKEKLSYIENIPLVYNDGLRAAYSSTSVCGSSLVGKTAVVTGATGGIGYAISERLLNEGCRVIITGRDDTKLKESITRLSNSCTGKVSYIKMDQTDVDSLKNGVNLAFAESAIDLWVNCAGIFKETDRSRKFRGLSADNFFEIVNINLKSTVILTRMVADLMSQQDNESCQIINIASICGLTNHYGYTPYGISKTGVIEYTRKLAEEYQGKVLIEGVAPGSVATRMGTRHFGGDISGSNSFTNHVAIPEETAAVVCFLAGPVGTYLNGKTVLASAGERV